MDVMIFNHCRLTKISLLLASPLSKHSHHTYGKILSLDRCTVDQVHLHDGVSVIPANIVKQFLEKRRGEANWASTILARSQSSSLLPIPMTQTRFEEKDI
ncbi:hypothetical protein TNCV_2724771 [Trichonephila clavipes]|nr:hypothetical protein TNCV_2724771 [Trichonephila clavipes]